MWNCAVFLSCYFFVSSVIVKLSVNCAICLITFRWICCRVVAELSTCRRTAHSRQMATASQRPRRRIFLRKIRLFLSGAILSVYFEQRLYNLTWLSTDTRWRIFYKKLSQQTWQLVIMSLYTHCAYPRMAGQPKSILCTDYGNGLLGHSRSPTEVAYVY